MGFRFLRKEEHWCEIRVWDVYQKPPLEKPPGGTRLPRFGCDASAELPLLAGGFAAGSGFASTDFDSISCFTCSTNTFASVVFMQKFKFDEFCWSYFGLGLFTLTSDSPKMFVWPPPGGFNTRLELRSALIPTLNDVEVIFFTVFRAEKRTK